MKKQTKFKTPVADTATPKTLTRSLNLVRRNFVFYPHSEEDHQLLSLMKIPITRISLDDFMLLASLCKKRKVKIKIIPFESLEEQMIGKIKAKWKHDFATTDYGMIFSWPRKGKGSDAETTPLLNAIEHWYRRHHMKIDVVIKRTAKAHRILIKKVGA